MARRGEVVGKPKWLDDQLESSQMKMPKIRGVMEHGEVHIRRNEEGEWDVFLHDYKFHAGEMEEDGIEINDVVEQVLRKGAIFLIDAAKSDRSNW